MNSRKTVLFFSPFTEIFEHSYPEYVLQQHFVQEGWEVFVARCYGLLNNYCNAMAARGLTVGARRTEKWAVCHTCRIQSRSLSSKRFTNLDIGDHLAESDRLEVERYVAGLTQEAWTAQLFHDLPVAKYAAYEFLIARKIHSSDLDGTMFEEFREYVYPVALSALAAKRILHEHQPTRLVCTNTLYGVNRVWMATAENLGIPTYSVHGGSDPATWMTSIMVYRRDNERLTISESNEAQAALATPLSADEVRAVGQTLKAQLRAETVFVYSQAHLALPPNDTASRLGINLSKPIVLVPLASADERNANRVIGLEALDRQPVAFSSQIEWIRYIIDIGARQTDLQFVIRLHPRMFANRRESQIAPVASEFMMLLDKAPSNVVPNLPSQSLSLSDILQITSVIACGTSSVGQQGSAYGIPVVIHDPHLKFAYPNALGFVVHDQTNYVSAIEEAISAGWLAEKSLLAFRWFNFMSRGAARRIDWYESTGESESLQIRLHRDADRRGRAHFSRLPFESKQLIRGLSRQRMRLQVEKFALTSQDELHDVIQVVGRGLKGLEEVAQNRDMDGFENEILEHKHMIGDLALEIGVFSNFPNSLGLKMQNYAKS